MTLADARKAHYAARGAVPPSAGQAKAPAFKVVAKQWLLKHLPGLSNPKHRGQVEATLERFAYPKLGEPADRRDPAHAAGGGGAGGAGRRTASAIETAHRVAGRVTAVFDYAQDAGIIEKHPAANLTRVLTPRKTKKPMPSIPPARPGADARDARVPGAGHRLALQLMAYTFPRVSELLGFERTSCARTARVGDPGRAHEAGPAARRAAVEAGAQAGRRSCRR
jgi:hypothetical protein